MTTTERRWRLAEHLADGTTLNLLACSVLKHGARRGFWDGDIQLVEAIVHRRRAVRKVIDEDGMELARHELLRMLGLRHQQSEQQYEAACVAVLAAIEKR